MVPLKPTELQFVVEGDGAGFRRVVLGVGNLHLRVRAGEGRNQPGSDVVGGGSEAYRATRATRKQRLIRALCPCVTPCRRSVCQPQGECPRCICGGQIFLQGDSRYRILVCVRCSSACAHLLGFHLQIGQLMGEVEMYRSATEYTERLIGVYIGHQEILFITGHLLPLGDIVHRDSGGRQGAQIFCCIFHPGHSPKGIGDARRGVPILDGGIGPRITPLRYQLLVEQRVAVLEPIHIELLQCRHIRYHATRGCGIAWGKTDGRLLRDKGNLSLPTRADRGH